VRQGPSHEPSRPTTKSEAQLRSLEEQFSTDLVAALRECAAGTWGLFGQNDLVTEWSRPKIVDKLIEDGEEIEDLRRELGFTEPFQPFKRFLEFRQMRGSNAPGESKLAIQFLKELGVE
jgi:hypothetical protein